MKIYLIMHRDLTNEYGPDAVVCASQYQWVVDHDLALFESEAGAEDYYTLEAEVD